MKTYSVNLSGEQGAAVALFAKRFRLSIEDAIKVLAFMTVNTWGDECHLDEFVRDTHEALQAGRAFYGDDTLVCGHPELDMAPAPAPVASA